MAYRSEKLKHGLPVRETMVADSLTLNALSRMLNGNYYSRFVIVGAQLRPVYMLTETDLEDCLTRYGRDMMLSQLPPSAFSSHF